VSCAEDRRVGIVGLVDVLFCTLNQLWDTFFVAAMAAHKEQNFGGVHNAVEKAIDYEWDPGEATGQPTRWDLSQRMIKGKGLERSGMRAYRSDRKMTGIRASTGAVVILIPWSPRTFVDFT